MGYATARRNPPITVIGDTVARAMSGAQPRITVPLDIPTPDGNTSVTHPSVVYFQRPWNGYRYWMLFTPYPDEERENPCIVASNDKVTWVVPAGLTNPIFSYAEAVADGWTFNSDPELVYDEDGDQLVAFWRGSGTGDGLYRSTSSDGVTWSEAQQVTTSATVAYRSPAIVIEADGTTWSMWCTKADGSLVRYQSTDKGVTWGSEAACTFPSGVTLFHQYVARVSGVYHMLAAGDNPDRLYYWTSTDGLAWSGSTEALPLISNTTPYDVDSSGNYRSCFLPRPGSPLTWDIFRGCVKSGDWRITLEENVILVPDSRLVRKTDLGLWLTRDQFAATIGSPTMGLLRSNRYPVWLFGDSALVGVSGAFVIPEAWATSVLPRVSVNIYWTQDEADTGSGDVVWQVLFQGLAEGSTLVDGDAKTAVTVAAPNRQVLKKTTLVAGEVMRPGWLHYMQIRRRGSDAGDTFSGNVALLGVEILADVP